MQPVSDLRHEAEVMRAGKSWCWCWSLRCEDCPYCRTSWKGLFLLPMQRNADYDDKILVRSISLDRLVRP